MSSNLDEPTCDFTSFPGKVSMLDSKNNHPRSFYRGFRAETCKTMQCWNSRNQMRQHESLDHSSTHS